MQFTHDFANGYPTKETVEKLYDERRLPARVPVVSLVDPRCVVRRVAAWAGVVRCRGAATSLSSSAMTTGSGILTPNATTPYYIVFCDLSAGPVVIDLPPNVRGGLIDGWQRGLPDTSRSAKYLVLGPGQEPPADIAGFEVRRCPTFNMLVGVRITVTDPKEAAALLAQFRAYPYCEAGKPADAERSSRRREGSGAECRRAAWAIGSDSTK